VLGAVDLVAVRALETGEAVEVRAAMRIGDDDVVVARRGLDCAANPLGAVVQLGRYRPDLDVPASTIRDLADGERQGPTRDNDLTACDLVAPRPGRCLCTRDAHPGSRNWSMKRSLKSARPESSTYSTSSRIALAAARSVTDSATIFAPSPATFPAATIRGSASFGTSPIRTALAGDR